MGSFSPKTQRKGFSQRPNRSHAAQFPLTAGLFASNGMSWGNARAAALYSSEGNGASYAAISSGRSLTTHPLRTMRPVGNQGDHRANALHNSNAVPASLRAVGGNPFDTVGKNPFDTVMRQNLCSYSIAIRSPRKEPQS